MKTYSLFIMALFAILFVQNCNAQITVSGSQMQMVTTHPDQCFRRFSAINANNQTGTQLL